MKLSIAYTETCLSSYFSGDHKPWICIYPSPEGYTSRQLREAIKQEFIVGAVGGNTCIGWDFIPDDEGQVLADKFYSKLDACLNRCIKYRGKIHKYKDYDIKEDDADCMDDLPLLHVVFDISELIE